MSDSGTVRRSAEEIEADLARTRAELTDTVNLLSERLSPKAQLEHAKQSAREAASDLNQRAAEWADTASGAAASFAETVSLKSKDLVDDATEGDPRAIAILGGLAAGVAVIATAVWRRLR